MIVTNVYSRIGGKLAKWNVFTPCHVIAISSVREHLGTEFKAPVLAFIRGGKVEEGK